MNNINYRMTKLNVSSVNLNNIYDANNSKGLNNQIISSNGTNLLWTNQPNWSNTTAISNVNMGGYSINNIQNMSLNGGIIDNNASSGIVNQYLASTGTGIKWVNPLTAGGTYTTPTPISIIPNVNFFVAKQNILVNSNNKYLVIINYTIQQATGVVYATMGRQNNSSNQIPSTSYNLASPSQTFIIDNSIGTPTYFAMSLYATSASSTVAGSITLIDTPNVDGIISYGLWVRSSACNITKYNITILQI